MASFDQTFQPHANGGKAHLANVLLDPDRYANILLKSTKPKTPLPSCLTNMCTGVAGIDERHKVLCWKQFLLDEEVSFLRRLVYNASSEDFGTQYVMDGSGTSSESEQEDDDNDDDDDDDDDASEDDDDDDGPAPELSAETLAMLASMGLAPPATGTSSGSKGSSTTITKNRLRTSSFLRTAWFGAGEGLRIFQTIAERAATMLGLDPTCAEAPQVVCYPGGATYFRPHHDSGRLDDTFEHVELGRDEHGAARITTVFVYLSSHDFDAGGATHFGYLQQDDGSSSSSSTCNSSDGVRVIPHAGSAAVWSNVDIHGVPDVAMIHEGESLNSSSLVTMEDALKDESLPLKIGLNLWFTDRKDYPRPEVELAATEGAGAIVYAAVDVH